MGVWIETYNKEHQKEVKQSHPSWVCGLKRPNSHGSKSKFRHTLRGCVDWNKSESFLSKSSISHTLRGCVDWNITSLLSLVRTKQSHPSWVCGLKRCGNMVVVLLIRSHPSWVCGLKLKKKDKLTAYWESHPSWVCGLKHLSLSGLKILGESHPSWVCGLNLVTCLLHLVQIGAPALTCI